MDNYDLISLAIGFIGLFATVFSSWIAYISYINPMVRFNRYIQKPNNWEMVMPNLHTYIYRHKKYPGFQILVDWDEIAIEDFFEEWMVDYPDAKHNTSYQIKLYGNGIYLDNELFVSLDGGRGFVPVPRTDFEDKHRSYFYTQLQIRLANIIGKYPRGERNIRDFAKNQKKPIIIKF